MLSAAASAETGTEVTLDLTAIEAGATAIDTDQTPALAEAPVFGSWACPPPEPGAGVPHRGVCCQRFTRSGAARSSTQPR